MKKLVLFWLVCCAMASSAFAWTPDRVTQDTVSWLYQNWLTKYEDISSFHVDNSFTREQAAKFFWQFAINVKWQKPDTSATCTFSDIHTADATLKDSIITSCQLGIFQWSKGKFDPKRELSFPEAIAVLMRIQWGKLDETSQPWYTAYWTMAQKAGVIPHGFHEYDMITRGNIWYMLANLDIFFGIGEDYMGCPPTETLDSCFAKMQGEDFPVLRDITKHGYRFMTLWSKNNPAIIDNNLNNRSSCTMFMTPWCHQVIIRTSDNKVIYLWVQGSLRLISPQWATYSYGGWEGTPWSYGSMITSSYINFEDRKRISADYSVWKTCTEMGTSGGDPICLQRWPEKKSITYRRPNVWQSNEGIIPIIPDATSMKILSRGNPVTLYVDNVPTLESIYFQAKELY